MQCKPQCFTKGDILMNPDFNGFFFNTQDDANSEQDEQYGKGSINFEDLSFDDDFMTDSSSSISMDSNNFYTDPYQTYGNNRNFQSAMPSPLEISPETPKTTFNIPIINARRYGSSNNRVRINSIPMGDVIPFGSRPIFPMPARLELSAMEMFRPRSKKNRPLEIWTSSTIQAMRTDQLFNELLSNRSSSLNPTALKFIPSFFWPNKDIPFVDIVFDFFRRKNNINCRFLHKLYNAIQISTISDMYADLVGVRFITTNVLKVNKGAFARLLGIKSVDGGLFHKQGNFPTHSFVELTAEQAAQYCEGIDLSSVDFDEVRLLVHLPGIFTNNCTEPQVFAFQNSKQR